VLTRRNVIDSFVAVAVVAVVVASSKEINRVTVAIHVCR
jgi:hypothetical protein